MEMRIFLDPDVLRQAERMLAEVDILVRSQEIDNALRAVGNQIKRDLRAVLPKPGYPGDKPELRPLRDSISVRVKNYRDKQIKVLIVGYGWPSGAHGQPLEKGHEKWLWGEHIEGSPVDPYPYLGEVVQMTKQTQERTLLDAVRKSLAKIKQQG